MNSQKQLTTKDTKSTKERQKKICAMPVPDLSLCHYGEFIKWNDAMRKEIDSSFGVPHRLLGRDSDAY